MRNDFCWSASPPILILALLLSVSCAHGGGGRGSGRSSGGTRSEHHHSSSAGSDLAGVGVGLLEALFSGVIDAMASSASNDPPTLEVAVWSATFSTLEAAEQFQRALPEPCVIDSTRLKNIEQSASREGTPMHAAPAANEGDIACAVMQETDDSYSVAFGLAPDF